MYRNYLNKFVKKGDLNYSVCMLYIFKIKGKNVRLRFLRESHNSFGYRESSMLKVEFYILIFLVTYLHFVLTTKVRKCHSKTLFPVLKDLSSYSTKNYFKLAIRSKNHAALQCHAEICHTL